MFPSNLCGFRSYWLASDLHRRQREASCLTSPLQTLDTDLFFSRMHTSFGSAGQMLKCHLWQRRGLVCTVPSATIVSSVPRSQNKAFSSECCLICCNIILLWNIAAFLCATSSAGCSCIVQGLLICSFPLLVWFMYLIFFLFSHVEDKVNIVQGNEPYVCILFQEYVFVGSNFERVLRFQIEERPPIRSVTANKLNKQSRTADEGWYSRLGVGRSANNPSL